MAQDRYDETIIYGQQRIESYNPFDEGLQDHDEGAVIDVDFKTNPFEAIPHRREFYQVNLEILQRRFNMKRGIFGHAASFFAELTWWQQGLIGLLVAGAAALIGLAFSVAWVIALPVIAFVLYAGIVYLFENQAQADKSCFEHMTEGFVEQQQFMQTYHEALVKAECQFQEAIQNINLNSGKLEGVVEHYKKKEQGLDQAIQQYQQAMQEIEPLRDKIFAYAQSLQRTESQFSEEMAELTGLLNQQLHQMDGMAEQALQTTQSLRQTADSLKEEARNSSVGASSDSLHVDLDALSEGYHFITDEERIHDQAMAQQRSESLRVDLENLSRVDEMIKFYQDSFEQQLAAKTVPIAGNPSITASEHEQVSFSPRSTF